MLFSRIPPYRTDSSQPDPLLLALSWRRRQPNIYAGSGPPHTHALQTDTFDQRIPLPRAPAHPPSLGPRLPTPRGRRTHLSKPSVRGTCAVLHLAVQPAGGRESLRCGSRQFVPVHSDPQHPDPKGIRSQLSSGVKSSGGGSGKHTVARKWLSCGAVPPKPQGTGFFPNRRGDQAAPPLREELSSDWRAGQWEAKTAAQRGAAAECKHSRERGATCVPALHPFLLLGSPETGCAPHPRAAMLTDVYLKLCSSLPTEVCMNPVLPRFAHPTTSPSPWVGHSAPRHPAPAGRLPAL